ncbi:MAG TPA: UDP-N-acetylmuramoyl-tripeptide--D-alanyl-D-alanine ligase [Blastocatellia bacterium]|nr:UDP-N-acetylmuramoyl-tripeptide--D-alanyl-D-alanine ligase [Blastocatellia bacterium]
MNLGEIGRILGIVGSEADTAMSNLQPLGYSIDSRTVRSGELFFAIRGVNTDGHRFVDAALDRGALAAVVARDFAAPERSFERKLIRVADTLLALQALASAVLRSWRGREVAVTGSSGKTTTKEILASLLERAGRVIKSEGNLNNHYGLPLSVLRMESDGADAGDYDHAVFEMGMNHKGEIARLTEIAPPDIGVVTNVAPVHLEFFSSVAEIADAKAEMVLGIKPGGTAVLNADDELVSRMARLRTDIRVRTFGIDRPADVTARDVVSRGFDGTQFGLVTPRGETNVLLRLAGRHNLYNALAAAAVADLCEVPLADIASALATCSGTKMRGEVVRLANGATLIDDSYNSNPRALAEMVDTLCAGGGRHVVVAGEMLELGESGPQLHRDSGRAMAGKSVQLIVGVRGLGREIVDGAIDAGFDRDAAIYCDTPAEAAELLGKRLAAGDAVLVKGSRGVKMETVVELLKQRFGVKEAG